MRPSARGTVRPNRRRRRSINAARRKPERGDQTHRPNPSIAPVGDGPYYAVAIHPGDLSTVGGLETNGRAQVLDAESQPIRGLYAAGLDMNSMMRGRYPGGGSSIGPAMTFGFVAVRDMARASAKVDPRQLAESL